VTRRTTAAIGTDATSSTWRSIGTSRSRARRRRARCRSSARSVSKRTWPATAEVSALTGALEKWEISLGAGVANFKRALSDGLSETSKAVDRIQPALAFARTPADLDAAKTAGNYLHLSIRDL